MWEAGGEKVKFINASNILDPRIIYCLNFLVPVD